MADRTHFYPEKKLKCDEIYQKYDKETNNLHYCEFFSITADLPIGDYEPITHITGNCRRKKL